MTTDTLSESIRYALLDIPKLDEKDGGSLSQLICVRIYTHDRHKNPHYFPTYREMMKENYVYEYIRTLLSRDDAHSDETSRYPVFRRVRSDVARRPVDPQGHDLGLKASAAGTRPWESTPTPRQ